MSETYDDMTEGLRIGIDMDGVLADFNHSWMQRYNEDFDAHLEVAMVTRWEGLHRLTHFESMDAFWRWARGDGRSVFRDAPAMPGAIESLRRIARSHRLVIVSSKFDWAIPDSLAWLAEHEVPAREVHFLWNKTLAPCDVFLDDAPHQLQELVAARPDATVCRMVQRWNEPVPGVVDIPSWADFERVIDRLEQERTVSSVG